MARVDCPDCKRSVSDAAASCVWCGLELRAAGGRELASAGAGPVRARTNPAPSPPEIGTYNRGPLACPNCGTGQVTRFRVIHENGLAHLNGMPLPYSSGGYAGGSHFGKSQTVASFNAAPPTRIHDPWPLVRAVVAGIFLLIFLENGAWIWALISLVVLGFSVRSARRVRIYNHEIYPRLKRKWENSYRCDRCGEKFQWGT
jgi:ribosomal protein L37AE/L43A